MVNIEDLIKAAEERHREAKRELLLHQTPSTKYKSNTVEDWKRDRQLLKRRVLEAAAEIDRLEDKLENES